MRDNGQTTGTSPADHTTRTHPPVDGPQGANWLAAYATGLAGAKRRLETSVSELAKAADGRPDRLVEASERLQELDEFDQQLRRRAQRLLTACLEYLEGEPSGSGALAVTPPDDLRPQGAAAAAIEGEQ